MQRHLERRDPSQNLARFYRVGVQPDLFGGVALIREWGRIGSPGTVRARPYPSLPEALAALEELLAAKRARGYVLRG